MNILPKCANKRCVHQATGLWRITFKKCPPALRELCAECGMSKFINRVRAFVNNDGELTFYKDVSSVKLAVSYTRGNVDIALPGAKAWALETPPDTTQPAHAPRIPAPPISAPSRTAPRARVILNHHDTSFDPRYTDVGW